MSDGAAGLLNGWVGVYSLLVLAAHYPDVVVPVPEQPLGSYLVFPNGVMSDVGPWIFCIFHYCKFYSHGLNVSNWNRCYDFFYLMASLNVCFYKCSTPLYIMRVILEIPFYLMLDFPLKCRFLQTRFLCCGPFLRSAIDIPEKTKIALWLIMHSNLQAIVQKSKFLLSFLTSSK